MNKLFIFFTLGCGIMIGSGITGLIKFNNIEDTNSAA